MHALQQKLQLTHIKDKTKKVMVQAKKQINNSLGIYVTEKLIS